MSEKEKEMKEVFENLNNNNKEILNLIAKGMELAQENNKKGA